MRAALALALTAVALAGCGGGGGSKASGGKGKPGTEEARGGTDLVAFPTGDNIADLLAGPGGVWVAYTGEDYLSRIDPESNEISPAGATTGEARALATDGRRVWLLAETLDEETQRYVDELTQIEPRGGEPIRTGLFAKDAEFADGALWVTIEKPQGVQGFDADSGERRGPAISTKGEPWGLAAGDGVVWAVDNDAGVVLRIAATTGEPIGDPIRAGESPFSVAVAAGAAWIPLDGALARVDGRSGKLERIPMPGMYVLDEIVSTGDALWVAEGGRPAKLRQIDPRSGRQVGKPRPLGNAGVNAIAAGHGAIWIALNDGAPATPDEVVRLDP